MSEFIETFRIRLEGLLNRQFAGRLLTPQVLEEIRRASLAVDVVPLAGGGVDVRVTQVDPEKP